MKLIIALLIAISFTACSSSKKKDEPETGVNAEETQPEQDQSTQDSDESEEPATTTKKETSQSDTPVTENAIECTLGKDIRKIDNQKNESNGCVVVYEKFGEAKEVANANHQLEYCDEIVTRIKGNLEAAGFTCN